MLHSGLSPKDQAICQSLAKCHRGFRPSVGKGWCFTCWFSVSFSISLLSLSSISLSLISLSISRYLSLYFTLCLTISLSYLSLSTFIFSSISSSINSSLMPLFFLPPLSPCLHLLYTIQLYSHILKKCSHCIFME